MGNLVFRPAATAVYIIFPALYIYIIYVYIWYIEAVIEPIARYLLFLYDEEYSTKIRDLVR